MRTWRNVIVVAAVAALGLSACGGDDDDGGGGGDAADEFCDLARQADTASDDIGTAVESGDREEIERVFNEAIADFEAAVDAAPEAIQDVAEQVTENAGDLRDRLEELDWDIVAFSQDEQALELATQGEAANTDLDQFLEDECGIPADDEDDGADAPDATDATDGTDGEAASDGSAPDEGILRETLVAQFQTIGLDAEQSECLADSLLDTLGAERLADLDPSTLDLGSEEGGAFIDALGECDIDPTDIAGG
jgi:hypothetical protein